MPALYAAGRAARQPTWAIASNAPGSVAYTSSLARRCMKGGSPVVCKRISIGLAFLFLSLAAVSVAAAVQAQTTVLTIAPTSMPRVGTVDERFQSYNIEAVEITGGRFWKPYASTGSPAAAQKPATGTPGGIDPALFEYRPPIDLSSPRLRKLATALGPAYLRVSGTWMNSTY